MAQKLLSGKHLKALHIALFLLVAALGFKATAQSVLLPGDVVIVSANADTHSIDFMPLIDIEEGTELYFSNGKWDQEARTLSGNELKVTFKSPIQAGTNIHLNDFKDDRLDIEGEISFEGGTFRLFAYQKEEVYRFIFAIGWGKGVVWNTSEEETLGSDIPESLRESDHTYLTLGDASNYQYYIRNGASGTRNLLLQYVGNESHWRGSESKPFPIFGTSFNLLAPPVVLFDQSVSTVQESDSVAILNVAIYEHDGSRLSVDVKFDTLRSITSPNDYTDFKTTTLNFTGLIGDGVYEVRVPITDDSDYEGRETGIFTLQNLTKGNYGDFLTHSKIILDNEKPEVLISQVINAPEGADFVELRNMEDGVVSLNGWSLSSKDQKYTFAEDAVLFPQQTIRIKYKASAPEVDSSETTIYTNLDKPLLNRRGGQLVLKDFSGEKIHEFKYSELKRLSESNSGRDELVSGNVINNANQQVNDGNLLGLQASVQQLAQPGLKVITQPDGIKDVFPEARLKGWNESEQQFVEVTSESASMSDFEILIGHFEGEEAQKLAEWKKENSQKKQNSSTLSLSVSATDYDQNEALNGTEGLNLVYNNVDSPVSVQRILELAEEKYPEVSIKPLIYGVKQNATGDLDFVPLQEEDQIPAQAPFWIILENTQPEIEINFDLQEISQPAAAADTEELTDGEITTISLMLNSQAQSETVTVHFVDNGTMESVMDLNSYPELFLGGHSFLDMAFSGGEEYFSEITLSSKIEQALSLPLQFSTSGSGKLTLSISEWEAIPADWEIKLEDKAAQKEYVLREDFSMTFDHTALAEEASQNREASLSDYAEKDRFVIHIQPPGQIAEGDEEDDTLPREVELHQNFPNPFNPATIISFYLPESEEVRLSIFNIVGQPVAVIAEGTMSAGEHQFEWDATDKPSGMYIYQLEVGKSVMTRKMTLVK
ncbi:lamin tail domain-containing protein [Gracilimonas sediminicola]|uniref:Lamin tail domain-containing protein n=1 Tax=Gracilimonas sediminicola TaxID=2952158 RepID=A0A9X2RFM1_9BACT|nr:lamin tail domain-containing protein [Gracilimonas sediminicola]MCP9290459.1 lamin tail domain-containing protein [Gracilimonas sediminicola]